MTGVLTQHEYVTAEHERINEQLRQELNTVFAATTLTPVQRQMIGSMMEDFDAQIEIIVKAGKLIHTELKSALIELEKAEPVS
jgi:DNA replication protein DnaD